MSSPGFPSWLKQLRSYPTRAGLFVPPNEQRLTTTTQPEPPARHLPQFPDPAQPAGKKPDSLAGAGSPVEDITQYDKFAAPIDILARWREKSI